MAYVDRDSASLVVIDSTSGAVAFRAPLRTDDAGSAPRALPSLGGPDWSPDGSRIAFNCWDGRGDEVCLVDADGTGRRQITRIDSASGAGGSGAGSAYAAANTGPPSWSPNGTSLAVAAFPERRGAVSGVFLVDLDNGTARKVSPLLPNSEIVWFSGGDAILFSATEKGRSDAVKVSTVGESVEQLTAVLPDGARTPDLTYDDAGIAVISGGSVIVLHLRDSGYDRVTPPAGLSGSSPTWSPVADELAFTAAPNPIANFP